MTVVTRRRSRVPAAAVMSDRDRPIRLTWLELSLCQSPSIVTAHDLSATWLLKTKLGHWQLDNRRQPRHGDRSTQTTPVTAENAIWARNRPSADTENPSQLPVRDVVYSYPRLSGLTRIMSNLRLSAARPLKRSFDLVVIQ